MNEYPEADLGLLVHTGSDVVYLDKDIAAIPWDFLAGVSL